MPKNPAKKIVNTKIANNQVNVFALLSLIFGILFFVPFGSILAIVFGFIALSQITKTREHGRGMAIAGIVLGFFWILVLLLIILFVIIAFGSALMLVAPLVQ
jgi:hypothetical protein